MVAVAEAVAAHQLLEQVAQVVVGLVVVTLPEQRALLILAVAVAAVRTFHMRVALEGQDLLLFAIPLHIVIQVL